MALNPINTADPANRKLIIELYEQHGEKYVKVQFGVTRYAINRWKTLERDTKSLAPRFHLRGRHAALTPPEVRRLERALLHDPYLTNRDLATLVGNKISPRAAGNYVKNSSHRFVSKLEQQDVEATFKASHVDEGMEFHRRVTRIPLAKRIYVDETWISAGVRRRTGRFPSGTPAWTPRNRKYPRKTVISSIRQDGFIQPSRIFNKGSITTAEFEDHVANELAPHLQEGDVVLWDRLGKSGRARNPTALHFSPTAAAAITARGARLMFLPPYGKFFDPIELVFSEVKRIYDQEIHRRTRFVNPSSLTFQQLSTSWHKAEQQISASTFTHAFRERANGEEFFRVCQERGLL